MRKLRFLVFLIIGLFSLAGLTALNPQDDALGFNLNVLKNPGAERGAIGWDLSGSGDKNLSTTLKAQGRHSFFIDGAAQNDEFCTELTETPEWLTEKSGGLCESSFLFSGGASFDPKISYWVENSTGDIITNSGAAVTTTFDVGNTNFKSSNILEFSCQAGSSYKLCIRSDESVPQDFYIDNAYLGGSTNVGSVAQAEFVGATIASVSSGSWTTSTSMGDVTATTVTYTNTGDAQNPSSNYPGFKFATLTPGNYQLLVVGSKRPVAGNAACRARIFDGTSEWGVEVVNNTADTVTYPILSSGFLNISSTRTNVDIRVQLADDGGAGNCQLEGRVELKLYRFPTESEIIQRIGAPFQELTSYTPTGTWTNTTYTGSAQCIGGGKMWLNVRATATGTPAGNLGFDLPSGYTIDTTGAASTDGSFGFPASVIGVDNGIQSYPGLKVSYFDSNTFEPITTNVAGTYPTGGQRYTSSAPFTVASGDFVEVTAIIPVNECPKASAGLFKNGVTTDFNGVIKMQSAKIALAASSSISGFDSDWITQSARNGTGDNTFAMTGFSQAPQCQCTGYTSAADGSTYACSLVLSTTATSIRLKTRQISTASPAVSTAFDATVDLSCWGPQ